MTLREYKLQQLGVSGITQKSIDKDGVQNAVLIQARVSDDSLDLLYEVPSSHGKSSHVNVYGQAQPFLTHGYSVQLSFFGTSKIVPKNWTAQGKEAARQCLKQIIDNADVKVGCDCPAFYWQGMWEGDDAKKTDYLDFAGSKGSGLWQARHADSGADIGQQMCKHIYSASNSASQNLDQILDKLGVAKSLVESYIECIFH